ncbi:MAG TPA: hypothetical protein VLG68_07240 [Gammaproteobacteria bacterium]|nr:hypothetical protein [Gammaproteobacteria bacterium]
MNTRLQIASAALVLGLASAGSAAAQTSGSHARMRMLEPGASGTLYLGKITVSPTAMPGTLYLGSVTVTPAGRYAANGKTPHSRYPGTLLATAEGARVAANTAVAPGTMYLGRITVKATQTVAMRTANRSSAMHNVISFIRALVFAR